MSKLALLTLALDAVRFLPTQLYTFNRLECDWTWYVVEGVAGSPYNSRFNKTIRARLSVDGTTDFLNSIKSHPRVRVLQKAFWKDKVEMCNAALEQIKEPCVLMQVDADEFWYPRQIESIAKLLDGLKCDCARFFCRYFVGPNLITSGHDCFGNTSDAWWRAWVFRPGQRFISHAPPVLEGCNQGNSLERYQTLSLGLRFDHYAYVYPEQVAFKELFYGYKNALVKWRALQEYNGQFPARLSQFLDWVKDEAMVERVYE